MAHGDEVAHRDVATRGRGWLERSDSSWRCNSSLICDGSWG